MEHGSGNISDNTIYNNDIHYIKHLTNHQTEYLKTLDKDKLIKMIITYDKIIETFIGNLDNYLYDKKENH